MNATLESLDRRDAAEAIRCAVVHTPGPWDAWIGAATYGMTGPAAAASMIAIGALRNAGYESIFVEISSVGAECPAIALGDTKERAQANARLIAAAPEGLDAAREALMALVAAPDSVCVQIARKKLKSFIAKAEGGAS